MCNGPPIADARSLAFPIIAFATPTTPATDHTVRLNIGLTGMIDTNEASPIYPTDSIDVTLQCGSKADPRPIATCR